MSLVVGIQGLDGSGLTSLTARCNRLGGEGHFGRSSPASPAGLDALLGPLESDAPAGDEEADEQELENAPPDARASAAPAAGDEALAPLLVEVLKQIDLFRLVLITPGLFRNGWYPDCVRADADGHGLLYATPEHQGAPLGELVAARVEKAVQVGGWDRLNNRPRRMYRGVPAGSIYLFRRNKDVDPAEIVRTFHGRVLAAGLPPAEREYYERLGYGLAAVGVKRP